MVRVTALLVLGVVLMGLGIAYFIIFISLLLLLCGSL